MYNQDDNKKTKKIIIAIIVIIIIILLLLHSCLNNRKNKNGIDICTGDNCVPANSGILINCMIEVDDPICVIPDFRGKTEDDINKWLSMIANNIDITYMVFDSDQTDGIVIDQSNTNKLTVKDLLDNNIPLTISFANTRTNKVDCLKEPDNKKCIVPDFTGKTKQDVYEWLNRISNDLEVYFEGKISGKKAGTVINQSVKVGTRVKDLLDDNKKINISFANTEKVDCTKNANNDSCAVPNFTGYTQREIEEWLDSISNASSIVLNYESDKSDAKSGTVLSQSIKPGTSIEDLINSGAPLTITFATNNDDSKVDCLENPSDSKCVLPNFSGMTKEDVENWLNNFSNIIPVRYENVTSSANKGTITGQSISSGTTVKDILDNNLQLVISVSGGKSNPNSNPKPNNSGNNSNNNNQNTDPTNPTEPDEPEEPIPDEETGEVIVKDSDVTWETETQVNIFKSNLVDNTIAPESSNTYRFTVYNNTESNVKYNLSFTETNESGINMKYKLRKNNSYIVSEYSSISQLNLTQQLLNASKNDVFYLEWKWISNSNDTDIGASGTATYNLNIKVEAEATNE